MGFVPALMIWIFAGVIPAGLLVASFGIKMLWASITIAIIMGVIPAGALIGLVQSEKRRKAEEPKRLQKEEEARRLEAEQRAEEKRRLEEEARLQQEKTEREREQREQRQAEEIRRRNEAGARKRELAREWVAVTAKWEAQNQKGQPRDLAVMAMIKIQRERAQKESDPDVRAWLVGNIRELQRMLNQEDEQARQLSPEECIRELAEIVRTAFLVKSCPRCHENKMALIEVSPNAKSIEYACAYCGKRQRAIANSPDAQKVKTLERFIVAVHGKVWFKTVRNGYRCTFSVPEATLPYERPTREPIPEALRAEVWRRGNGQCVKCKSRENLHIDHIIPVSKGGATDARNLQLLCQSCNLSKGAKI